MAIPPISECELFYKKTLAEPSSSGVLTSVVRGHLNSSAHPRKFNRIIFSILLLMYVTGPYV